MARFKSWDSALGCFWRVLEVVEAFCEIVLQLMGGWSAAESTQGGILHLEFQQEEHQEPCW